MHDFQILFDHGEHSELLDPVYSRYGKLGFPSPPPDRPWVYANFVQTLDGLTSLLGRYASGSDIAQSEEDRWLMDLLRAHADAVLLGVGTLIAETRMGKPRPRGPVFRIVDPPLQQLRAKLRQGREKNIFVTATGNVTLADYAVFDGEKVDAAIITSPAGAERLASQLTDHPHVQIQVSGSGREVDLVQGMAKLRSEMGIRYLLCEGGPTLYGAMLRDGLIDEKFVTLSPFDAGLAVPSTEERPEWDTAPHRPTIFAGEGFSKEDMARWSWVSCRRVGDHQFSRYRRIKN